MDTNLFAVTGNPVLHSLSPVLLKAAGCSNYFRLCALTAEEAIKTFKQLDFKGLNVTAPFKKDVIPFLDTLTENAKKAGAVNCIFYSDGKKLCGDNTDIKGVELTLLLYPEFLKAKKMLVIGSGGATPAVIIAGQNLGLEVTVTARNVSALQSLKERFSVQTADIKNIEKFVNDFPVIVQALPSGVKIFEPEILTKNHVVLDANYKNSIFEKPSETVGYKFLSGKNWLVNQAVPSYENFTGKKTSPEIMYKSLGNYGFQFENRIALTGFMGVGKTTSGKKLAELTGWKFIDSDDEIEKIEGMKISQIFAEKGEEYFRKVETEFLHKLSHEKNVILSCGGGTIKSDGNRRVLRDNFLTLWLYAPVGYCLDGLDLSNRPLLQCENPVEKAREIFQSRIPFYADPAYALINVENLNREQIAEKIYEQITKTFKI